MERTFIPEQPVGSFQISNLAAAITMAAAWTAAQGTDARIPSINAAQYILVIDAEGGNVRWRADKDTTVAITGATGNRIIQDTGLVYTGNSLSTLQFIQETGFTSKLNVQIFKHAIGGN
jgi:hypothetical protein